MIDHGMSTGSLAIAPNSMAVAADAARPPRSGSITANLGRNAFIALLVVLMLPAALLVSLIVLLVPCFFRVPVCGPVLRPTRTPPER